MSALVLGVGNSLLSDEGVGIHVINFLNANHPRENTTYLDGGTLSFTLASEIEENDALIIVDATELKSSPGTVASFQGAEMDRFIGEKRHLSVHEVGILDLLTISRLCGRLPRLRALVAIQPKVLGWGEIPSSEVSMSIPIAVGEVLKLLNEWRT